MARAPYNILIVDDEQDIRELIVDTLEDENYTTRQARNSDETFKCLAEKEPDAVILDIWLKDSALDGLGILEQARKKYPFVPFVMISGHGNIETAIKSIRLGAHDYIEKPFNPDRLMLTLRRAIEAARLKRENAELRLKVSSELAMVGKSSAMSGLQAGIEKVAPTGSRVFITGHAGTGKDLVARLIHRKSKRRAAPFVKLSAASLSPERAEYELLGVEDRGEVTVSARREGVFERAHRGTLYIDEITEMALPTQAKLLRILQDGAFERVGGRKSIAVDVRVIVSSTKDVTAEIKAGRFREDLYYRLNVVPLNVPSLKERREDIPALSEYFMKKYVESNMLQERKIGSDAMAALQSYDWPGNVRQLRNIIEWLLIMAPGDTKPPISASMLPHEIFASNSLGTNSDFNANIASMPLREARELFERYYLDTQVKRFGGNISKTSTFVGMERSALHRKLKSLGIRAQEKETA